MSIMVLVKSFDSNNGLAYLKLNRDRPDVRKLLPFTGNEGFTDISWLNFQLTELAKLPLVNIIYEFGVKSKIAEWKSGDAARVKLFEVKKPIGKQHFHVAYDISFFRNIIKIKMGEGSSYWDIQSIPGASYNQDKRYFEVPRSEAFRLFENLSHRNDVLYTSDVKQYIIDQIERRSMIDRIALASDWNFDVELCGNIKLRNFQRVCCGFLEATEGRALIADTMGLGKTVEALAYAIKNNLRTLVVCPAQLKANWHREIKKLSGKQPIVYRGITPETHDLISLVKGEHQFSIINYDIVGRFFEQKKVTTDAEGYKHESTPKRFLWVEAINMAKFDLIICDESHYIKNIDSLRSIGVRQLKADKLIHMTGTPILNRPGEYWPILNMIKPEMFPSHELFIRQYTYDGKRAKNLDELRNILKTIMIRRTQEDVIKDLPALNRINTYHELSDQAKRAYQAVLEGIFERVGLLYVDGKQRDESQVTNILTQIQRLKQVCAIDKIDSTADLATELQDSISNSPHNKVLIFSQFKATAFAIAQRLGHEALCFVSKGPSEFVTADNTLQDELVQQFQNDSKIKYLVVTEKTAKEGHNITKAGCIIFNDLFWTPAAHQQAEGRAYMRVGDPHGITAYYRIVDAEESGAEIEEWIWQLLQEKLAIIEETVDGIESARTTDTSIAMELIERIRNYMPTYRRMK